METMSTFTWGLLEETVLGKVSSDKYNASLWWSGEVAKATNKDFQSELLTTDHISYKGYREEHRHS